MLEIKKVQWSDVMNLWMNQVTTKKWLTLGRAFCVNFQVYDPELAECDNREAYNVIRSRYIEEDSIPTEL